MREHQGCLVSLRAGNGIECSARQLLEIVVQKSRVSPRLKFPVLWIILSNDHIKVFGDDLMHASWPEELEEYSRTDY